MFPPKHHSRALLILNEVLKSEPNNIRCLVSKAFIFQCDEKWREAGMLWTTVLKLTPEESEAHLEAQEEQAWCHVRDGHLEEGMEVLQVIKQKYDALEGQEAKKARVWWRLGKCI